MKLQKKYRVKITRWGYFYILITILIGLGAANTANNLLYLLAAALLALMLISGLSSLVNLTGLELTLTPPQEIFASQPAPFRVRLKRRRWPLPSILVGVRAMGKEVKGVMVPPSREVETTLWLTFPTRGLAHLEEGEVFSAFPLGFFTRSRRVDVGLEFLVYPRPLPAPIPWDLEGREGESPRENQKGQGDDILELRPYKEGDPPKRIDWKATARKGELVVREMTNPRGDRVTIRITGKEGNWEETLGKATYLVLESAKRGLAVGLVLPHQSWEPARGEKHIQALLEALALA